MSKIIDFDSIDTKGTLNVAGHLKSFVQTFKEAHFPPETEDKEVHLFMISVGISFSFRLPSSEWKKGNTSAKSHPGSHINTIDETTALAYILWNRGDLSSNEKLNKVLSEYLNGGLEWLKSEKADESTTTDLVEMLGLDLTMER